MTSLSGPGVAGPFDGTVWAVLSDQEQDKVLQTLADELVAVRDGRIAQAAADAQAQKSMSELLDDLYTPETGTAAQKYATKYADMALRTLAADAAKFARMAGAASVGDYSALQSELPRIGASVFATLVSDALDAKGMSDSKVIWDALVARAGNLQQVGQSLVQGDTGKAYDLAKKQAQGELETFSRNAVAGVINWAFSDIGVAPGQAYLKVIAYEKQFITWSKKTLSTWFIQSCLDTYVATHAQTGGQVSVALDRYQECSLLGGNAFAEREFAILIGQAGLDTQTVTVPMLEAYRTTGEMPHSWLTGLVARQIASKEAVLTADLAAAQSEVSATGDAFASALGQRLSALARAAMGEDDVQALLAAAQKALADSKTDADAVARASAGAVAACQTFSSAQAEATRLRDDMRRYGSIATDVRTLARAVPDCGGDAADLTDDVAKARRLQSVFDAALQDVQTGLKATCTARDGLATATDQDAARALVQTARDSAASAAAAIASGMQAHADFTPILQRAAAASGQAPTDINMDVVRRQMGDMTAKLAQLQAADATGLVADFTAAKASMAGAHRQATNLTNHAESRAKLVRQALEPHKSGPLGADIRALLAGLETALAPAQLCVDTIGDAWTGGGRALGWNNRTLEDFPDLAALERLASEAKARCPLADGGAGGLTSEQDIAQIYREVDTGTILFDIAKRGYERCLAEAFVAYSDMWGTANRPPVTLRESVLFVLDASGSMDSNDRMAKARASAIAVLKGMPVNGDVEVALMVFYDCGDIRLEVPFTLDPNEIITLLPNIRPSGSTPLAAASAEGKTYLRETAQGARKRFILLTDGDESCGGNPIAAIRR